MSSSIRSFELSDCQINEEGLKQLRTFLNSCSQISNLTISQLKSRTNW